MSETQTVRDFPIEVLGVELMARHVRPVARSPGPPLLLLHEGLGSITQWKAFPEALAERTGRDVFLYDRRGYGRSDPLAAPFAPDYMHKAAFEEMPAALEALRAEGLSETPVLVGHSDGGSIALLFASRHDVPAVATLAAHVVVDAMSIKGITAANDVFRDTDLPAKLARHHGDKTEAIFRAWADVWLSAAFRDWSIEDALPAIRAPCLAIQGRNDEYGLPDQVHRIAAGTAGPAQTLLIPDCAHAPHRDAPGPVLAALQGFLDSLGSGPNALSTD